MQIEPSSQVVPSDPSVDLDQVKSIIQKYQALPGAMLPVLHAIQDALGYVPSSTVPLIAEQLNLSRAEVHGVISFYHHFRQQPAGRHLVQICRAEACQARGSAALEAHAKAALGCDFHGTSSDGQFTLEPVYCLGQCACGPSMLIDDDLHARVSNDKFNKLVRAKRGVA
ncbi:formate dehydrogenase subunit gamma [Collimonas sp. OK412]|jgi:formate dehydrogenase subunit gamma|uniref:formate dehydrogenase subunit gamma n=1 Tax=Collimonas sp. (strain OK412) TaxID=1801619 RepID=UPI0008E12D85|nr:formate dehydrogenase subunit gamma [Collimonas sp. OK412]SFD33526.1 formate dehydrogenase gamma subunit [Collimonas sp. OK412]